MTANRATKFFGTIIRFIRSALVATFFDPVAFISIFAPILISIALGLIYGQFVQINGAAKQPTNLDLLLANKLLPGILDYIIQYYTALLVLVVSFGKSFFNDILLPILKKPSTSTIAGVHGQAESTSVVVFHVFGIIVLVVGGWVLFVGAAKLQVLEAYTNHTQNFGTINSPPLSSPITWLRALVWFYSAWRFILENRMQVEHSKK